MSPRRGPSDGPSRQPEVTVTMPLYVFCGRHLLLARQRRANVAGCDGAVEEMARIIAQIRRRWPRVRITLRGDSGNDELMGWCEANRVDYVFGLARNRRLEAALVNQLAEAKRLCAASGRPARVFRDFQYCTIDSWSRTRRGVGKAEHTLEGANPRFIVTSLRRSCAAYDARALCANYLQIMFVLNGRGTAMSNQGFIIRCLQPGEQMLLRSLRLTALRSDPQSYGKT